MKVYPKIGIRPVIDGRYGGTRETTQGQAFRMAEVAEQLIVSVLRYSDGTPAQCVIADEAKCLRHVVCNSLLVLWIGNF